MRFNGAGAQAHGRSQLPGNRCDVFSGDGGATGELGHRAHHRRQGSSEGGEDMTASKPQNRATGYHVDRVHAIFEHTAETAK